ncbi:nitrate reductase [Ahrensia kielensis]|uniref:nitrate reductase n=1 Tax=Ahrensia kielensis TaxID=76980 RepID=UPI00036B1ED6|nr:nitrate reductase [Ahrensia kielensis]
MQDQIKTTCPYCGVGCGIIAAPQPDGSISIKGDPEHPANFGALCSKGSALGETLDLEGRLLAPQINGVASDWDNALNVVADTFNKTIAEHGPDSVAFYVSGQILTEDYYVANKLMKGFIGSANIDTNSRLCMASSVAGHRRAFGSDTVPGTYEDLELADVLVLVGSNLAWCHPVLYQRIVAAKNKRPEMKIVLIDPRRTMTADIADLHLAIAPDADVELFNGLFSHLCQHGAIDHDYINKYTNDFAAALDSARELDSEAVAQRTGLSLSELNIFYRLWAGTEKVVTLFSQGVNQSHCGTDKVNAIINCHLATGRIGKQGAGPFSITGQPNAMGGREVGGLANMLAAHMELENPHHRDVVQRFWGSPKIANRPGLKAVDMLDAVADGRIKAIWIMATNPVATMPDASAVENALKACPFVVVSDIMSHTDTTRHADVKLPSLGWGEKDGTVTNSERRISRQRAFLPAPNLAKADWWQMAEVAKRMGFSSGFNFANAAAVFREYAAQTAFENNGTRDLDIGAYANISDREYSQLSAFQWPQAKGQMAEKKDKRFFAKGGFYTPDRKANFVAVHAPKQVAKTAEYPFILNTGRIRDQWHTMTRTAKSPRLSSHIGEPFVEINGADAAALNIQNADIVRVYNARGSIIVRGLITERVKAGQVFVPMHFTDQISANARVDQLVAPLTDPISGQPALKSSTVMLEKFPARHFGFVVSAQKPNVADLPYWTVARAQDGWRTELSTDQQIDDIEDFATRLLGLPSGYPLLLFKDHHSGLIRAAAFDGEKLIGALFIGTEPVAVSRNWVAERLGDSFTDLASRWRIVAGRPSANMPDKGAIICACMNVGINEITDALRAGNHTVASIAKVTCAGTNCGSCKAEIKVIIDGHTIIAAE